MSYGLPFICPTDTFLARIQSQLCSTIRMVLALPRSTHTMSVFIEAGLMPLTVFSDYHILRTAYNMSTLPDEHAITDRYTAAYNKALIKADRRERLMLNRIADNRAPPKPETTRIRSIHDTVIDIEKAWSCPHTDLQQIKHRATKLSYERWHESPGGEVLKAHKNTTDHIHLDRSHYLYLDIALQHGSERDSDTTALGITRLCL